jgi:hypothetical protein
MTCKKFGTALLIIAISFCLELLREEAFSRIAIHFQQSKYLSKFFFKDQKLYAYPTSFVVTVNAQGNGSGLISGNLSGDNINATWNGSDLIGDNTATVLAGSGPYTLSAVANSGSKVLWSGCDGVAGNGTAAANCTINEVTSNETVTSSFLLNSTINYLYLPLILKQYKSNQYSLNCQCDSVTIQAGGKINFTTRVKDEQGAFITDMVTPINFESSLGGIFDPSSVFPVNGIAITEFTAPTGITGISKTGSSYKDAFCFINIYIWQ